MKLLFSTQKYEYLKNEILNEYPNAFKSGKIDRERFPDEELYLRIVEQVDGEVCCVIAGTQTNDDIVELISIASTLVTMGAKRLNIVIPYYGYATMERATKTGEVIAAKVRATLLSNIPRASYGNKFYFLDLHTPVITEFFEGGVYTSQINTTSLIQQMCNDITGTTEYVLATTDVGRAKNVEYLSRSYSDNYKIESAFCYKRRNSGSNTDITGVNADVKGKIVVIYDDMLRSGSSLVKAAEVYKKEGADKIYAVMSHGVLTNGWDKTLKLGTTINKLSLTNTHPNTFNVFSRSDGISHLIRIYSVAPIIGKALLD